MTEIFIYRYFIYSLLIIMWRKILGRQIITLIFIFILCSGPYSLINAASSLKPNVSGKFSSEIASCSNDQKPDLVIEDIFLWPSNFPYEYHFEYSVKNIGDSPIYSFLLKTYIQIRWMIFGSIPLFFIYSKNRFDSIGGLRPGDIIDIPFASCDSLPKFGSFRFSLTINPDKTIDESNFDNNKLSEDWFVFFGQWKPMK